MSREIKFRAWHEVYKTMWSPNYIDCEGVCYEDSLRESGYCLESDNSYILMQYVGLKDKNGKEIYEGDILGGIFAETYIAYCEECKRFELHLVYNNKCLACLGDIHWHEVIESEDELEVLSNIYENENLIGE